MLLEDRALKAQQKYLEGVVGAGIKSCHPRNALPKYLNLTIPSGNIYVIGAGKAAAEMATVVYDTFGDKVSGVVVTRYGHGGSAETGNIEILYSAHPVPDENGLSAAFKIVNLASQAQANDRVICLISGGGSALLTCPAAGIRFEEIRTITDALVKSGIDISEINCVRRHLSRVKGGRLANYVSPAQLETYAISDVVGDYPEDIASGPTVSSFFEPERAISILNKAQYDVSETLKLAILDNKPKDIANSEFHIIARSKDLMASVEATLAADGWDVINLGDDLMGDAAETGADHAKLVSPYLERTGRFAFISGGELTVDVTPNSGDGGPNLEYLAALTLNLPKGSNFEAIACDSDGIDGSRDNAGGYVSGLTLQKCEDMGLDVEKALTANDTYALFYKLNQLTITGPTGTNVNDIRIILVENDEGKPL